VSASDNAGVNVAIVIVAVLNGGVIVIDIAVHIEDWVPDVPDGAVVGLWGMRVSAVVMVIVLILSDVVERRVGGVEVPDITGK